MTKKLFIVLRNEHLLSEIRISYLYELVKPGETVDTVTVNQSEPFVA